MNVQTKSKAKGFTIIEVVLVLAIAGLILLMVLVALPALRKSQRDGSRKADATSVAAAVTSFTSNNRGSFPDTSSIQSYIGTVSSGNRTVSDNTIRVLVNSTSGAQTLGALANTATETSTERGVQDGLIIVTERSVCGDSTGSQVLTVGTARQFTVVTKLESGNGAAFCLNG